MKLFIYLLIIILLNLFLIIVTKKVLKHQIKYDLVYTKEGDFSNITITSSILRDILILLIGIPLFYSIYIIYLTYEYLYTLDSLNIISLIFISIITISYIMYNLHRKIIYNIIYTKHYKELLIETNERISTFKEDRPIIYKRTKRYKTFEIRCFKMYFETLLFVYVLIPLVFLISSIIN